MFLKLLEEAERVYGREFARFCNCIVDETDGGFYLTGDTWKEVNEQFATAYTAV